MRPATRLISSGPATEVPPYFCTITLIGAQSYRRSGGRGLAPPREQAQPSVRVRVQRPQRCREVADPQQLAGDPAARQLVRALRVLEPARDEPGARERPQVRPH